MIEKWLRNEIDKKICNSNRIVILDQSSRWKFLVDTACTDICLYSTKDYSSKWQQKQDELFLRHEIEKNHKNDQVVIYSLNNSSINNYTSNDYEKIFNP